VDNADSPTVLTDAQGTVTMNVVVTVGMTGIETGVEIVPLVKLMVGYGVTALLGFVVDATEVADVVDGTEEAARSWLLTQAAASSVKMSK
jgi:hypothetical protein